MIPYSWNGNTELNDGVNFAAYFTGPVLGLPPIGLSLVPRYGSHPYVGGVKREGLELLMEIDVLAGSADTLRAWFDYEDETPKLLVVTDDDGASNPRYWWAICAGFVPTVNPLTFLATLRVHGDVRLRSVNPVTAPWNVTSSGATTSVTNGSVGVNDDAFPTIEITPREQIVGGTIDYRRFVTVRWRASAGATQYPVDITNAGLDTRTSSTNFVSATGDDIRVYVDGTDVDYWLNGINTAATSIWVNLDWQPAASATLNGAISDGALSTLTVNEAITGFPSAGIVEIDSELFVFTGKDNASKTFSGVTRAAKGTTAASHSDGATVRWIQHDIWLEYGSATATAPSMDDSYKPIFALASSSNTSWDYDDFYELDSNRSGVWSYQLIKHPTGYKYGGDRGASATVYGELGSIFPYINPYTFFGEASWSLFNPCGITAGNFQNGEMFVSYTATYWDSRVRSSVNGSTWATSYSIPGPLTNQTWYSWSQNVTSLPAGTRYLSLYHDDGSDPSRKSLLEVADVTVTLDSNYTPTVAIGAETGGYRLVATLTNETTGDAFEINLSTEVDETLVINTDTEEITLLSDGSSQYQTVTLLGDIRRSLLRLTPGSNTLRLDITATSGIDIDVDITFEKRYRA